MLTAADGDGHGVLADGLRERGLVVGGHGGEAVQRGRARVHVLLLPAARGKACTWVSSRTGHASPTVKPLLLRRVHILLLPAARQDKNMNGLSDWAMQILLSILTAACRMLESVARSTYMHLCWSREMNKLTCNAAF